MHLQMQTEAVQNHVVNVGGGACDDGDIGGAGGAGDAAGLDVVGQLSAFSERRVVPPKHLTVDFDTNFDIDAALASTNSIVGSKVSAMWSTITRLNKEIEKRERALLMLVSEPSWRQRQRRQQKRHKQQQREISSMASTASSSSSSALSSTSSSSSSFGSLTDCPDSFVAGQVAVLTATNVLLGRSSRAELHPFLFPTATITNNNCVLPYSSYYPISLPNSLAPPPPPSSFPFNCNYNHHNGNSNNSNIVNNDKKDSNPNSIVHHDFPLGPGMTMEPSEHVLNKVAKYIAAARRNAGSRAKAREARARATRDRRHSILQAEQNDPVRRAVAVDADRAVLLATRAASDSAISNARNIDRELRAIRVANGTSRAAARGPHTYAIVPPYTTTSSFSFPFSSPSSTPSRRQQRNTDLSTAVTLKPCTSVRVTDALVAYYDDDVVNPWTVGERLLFLRLFVKFGKNFRVVASHMRYKSLKDVVMFYYRQKLAWKLNHLARRSKIKQTAAESTVLDNELQKLASEPTVALCLGHRLPSTAAKPPKTDKTTAPATASGDQAAVTTEMMAEKMTTATNEGTTMGVSEIKAMDMEMTTEKGTEMTTEITEKRLAKEKNPDADTREDVEADLPTCMESPYLDVMSAYCTRAKWPSPLLPDVARAHSPCALRDACAENDNTDEQTRQSPITAVPKSTETLKNSPQSPGSSASYLLQQQPPFPHQQCAADPNNTTDGNENKISPLPVIIKHRRGRSRGRGDASISAQEVVRLESNGTTETIAQQVTLNKTPSQHVLSNDNNNNTGKSPSPTRTS